MTKILQENAKKYHCIYCNFKSSNSKNYNIHVSTQKHIRMTNNDINLANNKDFACVCGKIYKYRQGLFAHRKKCNGYVSIQNIENNKIYDPTALNDNISSELITKLLMQNQELLLSNQKLQSQLVEAMKDSGNTINNTTNNNQKFNLNFFLNTTCKDALNMSDFIENMEVGFKDIENIGKNGYVSGMTDMILSRIKELDVTKRPLHCTDLKRETMYIKDNDEWSKDTPENSKLHKTIKYVAKRNYATIPLWRENYPECQDWNHPKYDFCVDMMRNILGDIGDEQTKLDNKIIKNLSKHIIVEKN
jgi:hypothetical protein